MSWGKIKITDGYWWWRESPASKWKVVRVASGRIRRMDAMPINLPGTGEFGQKIEQPASMIPSQAQA